MNKSISSCIFRFIAAFQHEIAASTKVRNGMYFGSLFRGNIPLRSLSSIPLCPGGLSKMQNPSASFPSSRIMFPHRTSRKFFEKLLLHSTLNYLIMQKAFRGNCATNCNIGSFLGINSVTLSRSPLSTPHVDIYTKFIHKIFSRTYDVKAHDPQCIVVMIFYIFFAFTLCRTISRNLEIYHCPF